MSPVSTEILDADVKTVRDAVHAVDVRVGRLEARIGVYVGIFSFLGGSILACVGYGLIWYGGMNARMDQLSKDVAEVRKAVGSVSDEVKALAVEIRKQSARVDVTPKAE